MLKLRPYRQSDAIHIIDWLKEESTYHNWCADIIPGYPPYYVCN